MYKTNACQILTVVIDIWSDQGRTGYYLEWEAALAKVQARLGMIPQEACEEIVLKCQVENIDFDQLKKQTELIGYPVLGVVQQIVSVCRNGLGEWCHWGATTQDVTDSATVLAIRASFNVIEADLDAIMTSVAKLAESHRSLPSKCCCLSLIECNLTTEIYSGCEEQFAASSSY